MAFWESKQLREMSDTEWESLCDGCGLCCLHKLEDVETSEVEFTCIKCRYLSEERRCDVYENRVEIAEGCLGIRDLDPASYRWLPESCAYRRVHEQRPLPKWHPLIAGSSRLMEEGGYAVGKWAISESSASPDPDFIIRLISSDS